MSNSAYKRSVKDIAKKLINGKFIAQQLYNISQSIEKEVYIPVTDVDGKLDISFISGDKNSVVIRESAGNINSVDVHTHVNPRKICMPPSRGDLKVIIRRVADDKSMGGIVIDGVAIYAVIPKKTSIVPDDLDALIAQFNKSANCGTSGFIDDVIAQYKIVMEAHGFWFWARNISDEQETEPDVYQSFDMSKHVATSYHIDEAPISSLNVAIRARDLFEQYRDLIADIARARKADLAGETTTEQIVVNNGGDGLGAAEPSNIPEIHSVMSNLAVLAGMEELTNTTSTQHTSTQSKLRIQTPLESEWAKSTSSIPLELTDLTKPIDEHIESRGAGTIKSVIEQCYELWEFMFHSRSGI